MDQAEAAKYFMLAKNVACGLSRDPSTKVGCILMAPGTDRILVVSCNGLPDGVVDSGERWERPAKYLWVEHAERKCLYEAARSGVSVEGATCVVTSFPCACCTRGLIQAGIGRLVTRRPGYDDPRWGDEFGISETMLRESGIHVTCLADVDADVAVSAS